MRHFFTIRNTKATAQGKVRVVNRTKTSIEIAELWNVQLSTKEKKITAHFLGNIGIWADRRYLILMLVKLVLGQKNKPFPILRKTFKFFLIL